MRNHPIAFLQTGANDQSSVDLVADFNGALRIPARRLLDKYHSLLAFRDHGRRWRGNYYLRSSRSQDHAGEHSWLQALPRIGNYAAHRDRVPVRIERRPDLIEPRCKSFIRISR